MKIKKNMECSDVTTEPLEIIESMNIEKFKTLLKRKYLWAVIIVLTYATCISLVSETDFGRLLRFKISTSSEYYVKRYVDKSPTLSDKIKIFAFSDKDLATLKRPNLFTHEWAELLSMIASMQPKVIFIDKIFSFLTDPDQRIKESIAAIEAIETPIIVGAFLSKNKINYTDKKTKLKSKNKKNNTMKKTKLKSENDKKNTNHQ